LPVVSLFDLFLIVFVQSEVDRSGCIEFDVNAGLVPQFFRPGWIQVTTLTGKAEEIVFNISFDLWEQHAGGSERRLFAEVRAFQQANISHSAQRKLTRDCQANHTTTDDYSAHSF
jgi:hypothetical protein